jgi:hypothetical protein
MPPRPTLILHHPLTTLLNAQFGNPIIGINHPLKTHPTQTLSPATPSLTSILTTPLAHPIPAHTPRPTSPRRHIPLHRALQYRRVMNTHTGTNRPSFKANRVKIVISPPLVVDPPGYLRGGGWCYGRYGRGRVACCRGGDGPGRVGA